MNDNHRQIIDHLFRKYARGIGSYIYARVGSADTAEQISSSVFMTVVQRIEQCRSSPQAWLWSIVRSELARYFRDRRPSEPVPLTAADPRPSPHESAEQNETRLRMQKALALLNDQQQRIVFLKFFQEMPNTEIAVELGLSPSNVGVIVHRAVARLRELMDEFPQAAGRSGPTESKEP